MEIYTKASEKFINQFIPSLTPILLNFKIEFLKIARSKKIILLPMPEKDLELIKLWKFYTILIYMSSYIFLICRKQ